MFNLIAVVLLFGLIVGSFSNVCIYRIPLNISVAMPRRSFCPWCNHQIYWHQNIPLLSFISQRGRCAFCKSRISPRYFWVEMLFPIPGRDICAWLRPPITMVELLFIGFILFFAVVISFIDLDWRIIPDRLSYPWLLGTLLFAPLNPVMAGLRWDAAYAQSMYGSATAAFIVWITLFLGRAIKNRDVMGWGDVKLMACWGGLLGWWHGIMVFFIAAVLATAWITVGFIFRKLRSNDFLPFGPFINIAGIFFLWAHMTIWRGVLLG